MKCALIALTLLAAAVNSFGQGAVTFSNSGMPGGGLVLARTGGLIPVGSTFQVALFWAPQTTPDAAFDSVAQQVGAPANFGPFPGYFSGGGRTINGLTPPGAPVKFQLRVWETAYGNSYDAVLNQPNCNAAAGKSAPFIVDTSNPLIGDATATMSTLIPRFVVDAVCPEPSAIALGLLGAGALLLLRRRK